MIRAILAALVLSALSPGLSAARSQAPADPVAPQSGDAVAGATQPEKSAAPTSSSLGADADASAGKTKATEERAQLKEALLEEMQPPDGEWKFDAEGRAYFIRLRPKSLPHRLLDDSRIQIVYGGTYELAGQDAENFWLKVYRPSSEPRERVPVVQKPTAAELAASAATFPGELAASDRLQLKAFDTGLPRSGMWRNGFDVADTNGDGKLDLMHGPPRRGGDQPKLFLGDGHGVWTPAKASVPSGLLDYGDVKVADFNRDGKADLAVASHLRGIAVFIGDGAGKYTPWGEGLDFVVPKAGYDGLGFSSRRLEVLDWNKDGKLDIVALSEGPQLSIQGGGKSERVTGVQTAATQFGPRIYLNQGDGTWVPVVGSSEQRQVFGDDLALADFDGDGRTDFVTSSNAMGAANLVYLNAKSAAGKWITKELPVRPRAYSNSVAVGDFDGDKRPDVALSYTSFELGVNRVGVDLYLARKDGSWSRKGVISRPGKIGFSGLEGGDVDGDGALDLVAVDHDGYVLVLLGDGTGGFSSETSPEAQQPRGMCRGYGLKLVDVDRDGKAEVLASFAGEGDALFDPSRCPGRGGIAAWSVEKSK